MNKSLLFEHILSALEQARQVAVDAAKRAHETATHSENVADNKYDTLGLEAAYLAHGQSLRVSECEADIAAFKILPVTDFCEQSAIALGALITLTDQNEGEKNLVLGPAAGGLKLSFNYKQIVVITPSSPLGQALIGHFVGDDVEISIGGEKKHYEISAIY